MMRWWRREPILTFVLAGGLSFWIFAPYVPWGRETIGIDARTVADIVERRANQTGRELTSDERESALDEYVEEEILLREAYANGWHLQNRRVRQRLVLAMRTALDEDVPRASTAQLRAYYRAHAERYRMPESVTFSHVFFEQQPPDNVLGELEKGTDFRTIGERFWLGDTLARQTAHQLDGALGPSFANTVLALEPGTWVGPIASNRGQHFVRVETRHPPELPELDGMKRFVEVDWQTERRLEIRERKMSRIREHYRVVER